MEMYPKFKPDASFIEGPVSTFTLHFHPPPSTFTLLLMEMYPKFKPDASFIGGPVYGNVSEIQTRR